MRTYLCPDCNTSFKVLHMTRDEPEPSECENCGAFFDEPLAPELAAPAIGGSALAKSADQLYRDMENSGAKLTNMRDNLRPGDAAAPALPSSARVITDYADSMGGMWKGGRGNVASQISAVKGTESGLSVLDAAKTIPHRGPHRTVISSEN